jgi:hypothetical protein
VNGRSWAAISNTATAMPVANILDVAVLVTQPDKVMPPPVSEFPVVKGTIRTPTGHLGAFEIVVDDYAPPLPSSRRAQRVAISTPLRSGGSARGVAYR